MLNLRTLVVQLEEALYLAVNHADRGYQINLHNRSTFKNQKSKNENTKPVERVQTFFVHRRDRYSNATGRHAC